MESLVLSPQDVENLEAMSDGSTGYFYKMLDYLEKRVEDGVRRGRFSRRRQRPTWRRPSGTPTPATTWTNMSRTAGRRSGWPRRRGARRPPAAACGTTATPAPAVLPGRLEEALAYAEKGVAVEPDYVWGWLQLGKLRSHFGDTAGALAAVERGLALEPGDYEFTTLAREIREGRSLEEMEYHWIDPEQDRRLQAGEAEEGEMADKRLAIACILCDRANLEPSRRPWA